LRVAFGAEAIRHYIISHTESVSDPSRSAAPAKGAGLLHGSLAPGEASRATVDLIVLPLFETIEDLRAAEPIMREFYDLPGVETLLRNSGPCRT